MFFETRRRQWEGDNQSDQHPTESTRQDRPANAERRDDGSVNGVCVVSDLPLHIPVDSAEIALLRAFLSDDIGAIMQDEE